MYPIVIEVLCLNWVLDLKIEVYDAKIYHFNWGEIVRQLNRIILLPKYVIFT